MTGSGEIDPVPLDQLERLLVRTPGRAGRRRRRRRRSGRWNGWLGMGAGGSPRVRRIGIRAWSAWEELDRADLEAHPEVRQRWWENWHDR